MSYNCRGWNSGVITLNSLINVCFVQEHWLISNHLHKINKISSAVGVSGMDDSVLISGRPYGGCSILYRKSLSSSVTPLYTHSNRFCAVKWCELSGSSVLLVNVYLPSEGDVSCFSNLLFVIFLYSESINFKYERDDGLVIDHVVCSQSLSSFVTDIYIHTVTCGTNLSDHLPLSFLLNMHCTPINAMPSTTSKPTARIDWSKATQSSIMMYQDMVSDRLSAPPIMFLQCSQPECTALLDDYVNHIVSIYLTGLCFLLLS
jgi:hypothetical protein